MNEKYTYLFIRHIGESTNITLVNMPAILTKKYLVFRFSSNTKYLTFFNRNHPFKASMLGLEYKFDDYKDEYKRIINDSEFQRKVNFEMMLKIL